MGLLGLLSLAVALCFAVGLRAALPWNADVFENVAWGKFFVGAVYAGLSVLLFWLFFHGTR
jgi:hypothetical protein